MKQKNKKPDPTPEMVVRSRKMREETKQKFRDVMDELHDVVEYNF